MRASSASWTSSTSGQPRGSVDLLELAVPALELALDVALLAAEVAEADGVDVDGVDRGQHVDDRLAGRAGAASASSASAAARVADDGAVDEAHDVERRAVDRLVGAQADGRGDRHVGRAEGGDDRVLAAHVVGGGQHVAERRPAQHPVAGRRRR